MDTIFAIATASGRAGVAVIRVSGAASWGIAEKLSGDLPQPRYAAYRRFVDPDVGELLDSGLLILFEQGRSFTGEISVEFHIHGGRAVTAAFLAAISSTGLARLAEPGEFTRRALINEKLDLTQVEGLSDLIDAETESQRKQSLRVLEGDLGRLVDGWRKEFLTCAALLAVSVDFADEEVPDDVSGDVLLKLKRVREEIELQLDGAAAARSIRDGFEIAIVGAPNVGKSTLLNRLAGREMAITSERAGTTRDVIEARLDIGGHLVVFLDMAGVRDSEDGIEVEGVKRARVRAEGADLRIFLTRDASELPGLGVKRLESDFVFGARGDEMLYDGLCGISGKTGLGVDDLLERVSERLSLAGSNGSFIARERHVSGLRLARSALVKCCRHLEQGMNSIEFAAEELNMAVDSVDFLIGRIGVEDMLGEIFSRFCLGK